MRRIDPRQLCLFDAGGRPVEACRCDALPEQTHYRDEGCELAPSCLNCPLPLCRYDLPGGLRRQRLRTRDDEIIRLRRSSRLPIEDIARRFGLSRRSVFRVLQHARAPLDANESRSQSVEEGFSPPRRLQPERQAQPSAHPGRPGQSHPSVGAGVSARPFTTQSRIGVPQ